MFNSKLFQYFSLIVLQALVMGQVLAQSDAFDNRLTFSHSYHFLDTRVDSDIPQVYTLVKDTTVLLNGTTYRYGAGEFLDIGAISQGKVIESDKPLSIGSNRSGVDMPVPIEFAGTEFVIPLTRSNHVIFTKNINPDPVEVEFFNGESSSTTTLQPNQIGVFQSSLNSVSASLTL